MTPDRRLRRYHVQPADLLALLRGTAAVVARPLPPDARLVDWGKDGDRLTAWVVVWSSAYPLAAEDQDVPVSSNGPVIAERRE